MGMPHTQRRATGPRERRSVPRITGVDRGGALTPRHPARSIVPKDPELFEELAADPETGEVRAPRPPSRQES